MNNEDYYFPHQNDPFRELLYADGSDFAKMQDMATPWLFRHDPTPICPDCDVLASFEEGDDAVGIWPMWYCGNCCGHWDAGTFQGAEAE